MTTWEVRAWTVALKEGWIGAADYEARLARMAAKLRAEAKL